MSSKPQGRLVALFELSKPGNLERLAHSEFEKHSPLEIRELANAVGPPRPEFDHS
jgi:hypothetical protein